MPTNSDTPADQMSMPPGANWGGADPKSTVQGWYNKYLGRQGTVSDSELDPWVNGPLGASGEQAFKDSPEAKLYGAYSGTTRTKDPAAIGHFLSAYQGQEGVNPSVAKDPAYWTKRITDTGGLAADNTDYWLGLMKRPEGAPEGGGGAPAPTGGSPFVSTTPAPTIAASSSSVQGVNGPDSGPLFQLLMDRARQSEQVDANDPTIKSGTNAFEATQTRSMRKYLADVAEKNGANSNIGAESRSAHEQVGQNTSEFESGLIRQEIAARRQEIQQALSGASGLLTSEQQMQLQDELARLGLAENQYQFGVSTNQNESQFTRNLAQRAYESDSGFNLRGQGL